MVAGSVSAPDTARRRAKTTFVELLEPLLTRDIAAIATERYPDYVVMYQGTKTGKQANVEQMATLIRRRGGVPPEQRGVRKYVLKAQSAITERLAGTTATLHAMRAAEMGLLKLYTETLGRLDGIEKTALRKALARTLVHFHLLTAHIAKRTGAQHYAGDLPHPLDRYFASATAKACMRCHLDRPGTLPALERRDPRPYTYICAGCHVDVRAEFPADLKSQIDRWPQHVREARVLQHAIGRPSVLNAIHTVLYPLSGLAAEPPVPAAEKAVLVPTLAPPPTPAADEAQGLVTVAPRTAAEAMYVELLFDYRSVRASW